MQTLKVLQRNPQKKTSILRKEGKIPAVFYGRKEAATPIAVPQVDFLKAWKEAGESTIISLSYDGKDLSALIHDVQVDPILGNPQHVDFYIVEADKEVEVDVPLEFVGISPAVKDLGGTLVKVLYEVRVTCFPKDLPHSIKVDISPLAELESQIDVKDLKLSQGVRVLAEPDDVVALVSLAKEEEETPTEEFDASKIEVEKKGKEEEPAAENTEDGGEKK